MELQKACFAYFQLGGRCVSTPVGLLAGIIPEPMTLMGHFFTVAFYGIFLMLTSEPIYMFPWAVIKSFVVIWKACIIFFPLLTAEMKR